MSSVFSKLKQFKDLREQGKKIQDVLSQESATAEASFGKVKITLDGTFAMKSVDIDPELLAADKKEKLQSALVDAHNDALKKIQRIAATKMQAMGDLNIPGLGGN